MSDERPGGKYTRDGWLRSDVGQTVMELRREMGEADFDARYDALYGFVTGLRVGQWFLITDLCRRNPANRPLVAFMLVMLDSMDFDTNLVFDSDDAYECNRVEIGKPLDPQHRHWPPPNVWLSVRRNPSLWGVSTSLIEGGPRKRQEEIEE